MKFGKSATEILSLLQEVYGDNCLSRTQVFEWVKRFKDGREDVTDDPRIGRPRTVKADDNIVKVGKIIRENRRLSIRAVSELINIDKESVR